MPALVLNSGGQRLFSGVKWHSVRTSRIRELEEEVEGIDGDRLLNTSESDLCDFLEEKFTMAVPALQEDRIVVDQREVPIDVSQDRMRDIQDRSRPFHIPGTLIEVTVPFSGEASAFDIQPTHRLISPARAEVTGEALLIAIEGVDLRTDAVRDKIERTLREVKHDLGWMRADAAAFNRQLPEVARQRIRRRREKLLADRRLVASLGFPLKERRDTARTFAPPEVQRKLTPKMLAASKAPYRPEPALLSEDYDHILSVVRNMALVMERSPSAFAGMDEEALRTHFLVQLNGHYEGQASGETFNFKGKTDILIRVDGKNIFIAECKFWDGKSKFAATIDQLLRYFSWRDTKAAVIVFNRNRDFTRVVNAMSDAAKKHPNFKREVKQGGEAEFRYVFSHRDDANREMVLTVLAFDIPTEG